MVLCAHAVKSDGNLRVGFAPPPPGGAYFKVKIWFFFLFFSDSAKAFGLSSTSLEQLPARIGPSLLLPKLLVLRETKTAPPGSDSCWIAYVILLFKLTDTC